MSNDNNLLANKAFQTNWFADSDFKIFHQPSRLNAGPLDGTDSPSVMKRHIQHKGS